MLLVLKYRQIKKRVKRQSLFKVYTYVSQPLFSSVRIVHIKETDSHYFKEEQTK